MQKEPELRVQSASGLALNLERVRAGKKPLTSNVLKKITKSHGHMAVRVVTVGVVALALFLSAFMLPWNSAPEYVSLDDQSTTQLHAGNTQRAVELAELAR